MFSDLWRDEDAADAAVEGLAPGPADAAVEAPAPVPAGMCH